MKSFVKLTLTTFPFQQKPIYQMCYMRTFEGAIKDPGTNGRTKKRTRTYA